MYIASPSVPFTCPSGLNTAWLLIECWSSISQLSKPKTRNLCMCMCDVVLLTPTTQHDGDMRVWRLKTPATMIVQQLIEASKGKYQTLVYPAPCWRNPLLTCRFPSQSAWIAKSVSYHVEWPLFSLHQFTWQFICMLVRRVEPYQTTWQC